MPLNRKQSEQKTFLFCFIVNFSKQVSPYFDLVFFDLKLNTQFIYLLWNGPQILPITEYTDYLQGYLRMHEYADQINQVQEVLICGREALIIFMTGFGDLHSFVRQKKRLKESEAVSLFHQIATIVANCHEEGIVLRDIKLRKFIFADDLKWVYY